MADGPINPPNLGQQGQTVTAFTAPSYSKGTSGIILDDEGREAKRAELQAQLDSLNALENPDRNPSPPTPEGVDLLSPNYERTPLGAGIAPPGSPVAPPTAPPKSPDEAYQDTITQAISGNQPLPPSSDVANGPGPTSRDFNALPELNRPRTFSVAQDEAAADAARQKATQAHSFQVEQARIEAQKQKDMQAAYQEIQQLAADKEKNTRITSLYEDMSTPRRILSRIALGLGAYGSALTGAPNTVAQMMQSEMQNDLEIKKAKAAQYIQRMQAAGARPEMIRAMAEDAQKHLLATQQAQFNTIEAQANQVLAPFPQAQQKAKQLFASKKEEITKSQMDLAKDLAERKSREDQGPKQVTTSQVGGINGRAIPAAKDVQDYSWMVANGKLGARLLELQKNPDAIPTPEMVREYDQNERVLGQRAELEAKHGKPSQWWSNTMRHLGAVPETIYPEGSNELQKEYLDTKQVLGHFRTYQLGGQTGLASAETRQAVMGPAQGQGGEEPEDQLRKDAMTAGEFVEAGKRAAEISKAGMQEQRVERSKASPITGMDLARLPAKDRAIAVKLGGEDLSIYMEARKVPKAAPEYPHAQAVIRQLSQQVLGAH